MKTLYAGIALMLLGIAAPALAQDTVPDESPVISTLPAKESITLDHPPADLFARDTYRIDTLVCPFKGDIDYEPGDIECGLLQVPENRENPDSRFIELHFVKLNSRWGKDDEEKDEDEDDSGPAPGKRDDPIIYLTGGPGAPVTYYVGRFKDHGILDHRDMYILEQRGIGFSGDFCRYFGIRKPEANDVETFEESLEGPHIDMIDCATNAAAAGVDLTGYNTIENARDVKALRRALGFDQWNVWGISYGSILGQAYIKEDPEGILAVALDAIMPLDIRASEDYWRVIHWYARDLQKLQEICQSQPGCAKRYPDLPGRLREAIQSMVGNPIVVDVKDVENFPSGKARIFHDVAALLPFIFLYEQDSYPGMPGLIYAWADAIEKRDDDFFKALASAAGGGFGDISQGMSMAILCIDGDAEAQANANKKDLAEYPVLGQALGTIESIERSMTLCDELGMPQRPAREYKAVQTDIPTLIIEGDMDPITPPPNAKAILPGFKNGTYVEFPYAGHGPSRSVKCAGDMLNKFYDNPMTEPDLSCVEEMEEPQMWAPMFTTSIAPKMMALLGEDKKKLALPGAWLGLSALIVIVAFLNLTFAPIGRRINHVRAVDTGGARLSGWLAATLSVLSLAILGAAFAVTAQAAELFLVFGLVPWAKFGSWAGVLAGVMGLVTIIAVIRTLRESPLPFGTWLGLLVTGLGALGFGAFLLTWGLGPF